MRKNTTSIFVLSCMILGLAACGLGEQEISGQGIKGIVLLGPHCPVVQEGVPCPDTPFQTDLVVTRPDGTRTIKKFSSDVNGTFEVLLPPGEYAITSPAGTTLPYCNTQETVIVYEGEFTEIIVYCDTGIR